MTRSARYTSQLITVFAVFVTIGGYLYLAIPDCFRQASDCFTSFAVAPFRYRILSVFLEGVISPGYVPMNLIVADIAIHTVCVLIVYFGMYAWLTRWFSEVTASVGILLICVAWMFAYIFYLRTVFQAIELACIVLALLALDAPLAVCTALVILASLNRETGVFLVFIWMAYHAPQYRTRVYWERAGVLMVAYAAITVALHISLGSAEHILGLAGTLQLNFKRLGDALILNAILLPIWLMAANGYRGAPPAFQRLAWVGVLSIGAILVGGSWAEMPRLALVVYPLVMPVVCSSFDTGGLS